MTIGRKLIASFGVMLAMTLALGISSLTSIANLSGRLDKAVRITARKIELIGEVKTARSDMLAAQRGVIMFSFGKAPDGVERARQLFHSAAGRWSGLLAELRSLLVTEEGRQLTNQLESGLSAWRSAFAEIEQLTAGGNPDAAIGVAVNQGIPIYDASGQAAQRIQELQNGLLRQDEESAAGAKSFSRWVALGLIGLSLAMGAVVLMVVRRATRTLQEAAHDLAEGADQVTASAAQVSESSQSLAQGASEQAASLQETSASSEEIAAMSQKNTEHSRSAADLVSQSQQRFGVAERSLQQMVTAMGEIADSSRKVSNIIKVIDEIAFQTNILALNASVEAARAGEAGMGFSVVADEVRSLAQRCAQAAGDTTAMIDEALAKSNAGRVKVDGVAMEVRAIAQLESQVKALVDQVRSGSGEQSVGLEQVAKAVTQMEKVTQSTAASAQQGAAASHELNSQSQSLRTIAYRLTALVGTSARDRGKSAAKPRLAMRAGQDAFPL